MQLEPSVKKPRLLKFGLVDTGLRKGRGFSIEEIRETGLSIEEAVRLGIPIDIRRKSKWEWNVNRLKEFLVKIGYQRS